jgi:hypothetical protein
MNKPIESHPQIVISVTPKALRPPAIAAMCGCTPGLVEDCWRDGSLKYKILGATRVSTVEQIDAWLASFKEESGAMKHPNWLRRRGGSCAVRNPNMPSSK